MPNCNPYYKCNSWNCQYCASTKLFWLRENALNFARLLAGQNTYFITVKGTTAIESALQQLKDSRDKKKSKNPRYNAKKEYFYVISKHNNSRWHLHLITNFPLAIPDAHIEPVRSLRAAVLYLVDNLSWSRFSDYGGRKRYGGSSILYMQSMRRWFITRMRLWRIITRYFVAMVMLRCLQSFVFRLSALHPQWRAVGNAKTHTFFEILNPQKIRPPPQKKLTVVKLAKVNSG